MTPEAVAQREALPSPEVKPSPALAARLYYGEFDPQKPLTKEGKAVPFTDALTALNNQNRAIRKADEAKFAAKFTKLSPEDLRNAHMFAWSQGVVFEVMNTVGIEGRGSKIAGILRDKLHIPLTGKGEEDAIILQKQLYDEGAKTEGDFYKNFCGNNMNEKLANALTVDDMMHLKTFLTKWMVGTDEAFTALVTLRHSMDMAKSGQIQSLSGNEQLPPRDVEILRFFHEGFLMQPDEDEKKNALATQNQSKEPPQEPTSVYPQEAQKDPEKARRFIFEQIQRTPQVERAKLDADLIQAVGDQMAKEKEAGKGKMKTTIPEMNSASDVDQSIPAHEGEVIFLPKNAGRVVALGDIHGDLKTIQQVLQKEHVLEDLTAGKPVQVVFMGDLVDRGLKDVEVMEAVLALKYLFPDHITIMKADHETAGGINPHDFPQHLVKIFGDIGGNALNTGYVQLFDQLPRMVAAANGTVFVHGGPSMVPWTLSQFAKFQGKDAETIFDNQMTWGDPIPMAINQEAEKGRQQARDELGKLLADPSKFPSESVRQQWMNIYNNFPEGIYPNIDRVDGVDHFGAFSEGFIYYDERAVQAFLERLGATNLIRAHQVSTEVMGDKPNPFGDRLYGIHTTGTGSDESHYNHRENNPRYATFDLSKPISGIDPAVNIKDVWK